MKLENENPIPAGNLQDRLNEFLPSEVEEKYAEAAKEFVKMLEDGRTSKNDLDKHYRDTLFPLAQQRIVSRRLSSTCFDVLYLTAGTQPYSQTLSVLATPAQKVVFIATDDSRCQECVNTAIKNTDIAPENVEVLTFPEPFSPDELARVLYYHHRAFPEGTLFAADITSGRKSMVAALSGFAFARRIPQFYLHAEYRRNFAVNEERQRISDILEIVKSLDEQFNDSEKEEE